MRYVRGFIATSTNAGATVITLSSSEEEPKHLLRLNVTDVDTNPVYLVGYLEREQVIETLYLPTCADVAPPRTIDIDLLIPVGQTFALIVYPVSAGSHGVLWGWIDYEIGAGR